MQRIGLLAKLAGGLTDKAQATLIELCIAMLDNPENRRDHPATLPMIRLISTTQRRDAVSRPTDAYFRNVDGKAIEISPELARLFDTTPEQLMGDKWHRFMDPADLVTILAKWKIASETGAGFTAPLRVRTPLGRIVFTFMRVRPWVDRITGKPEGFIGTVHANVVPVADRDERRDGADSGAVAAG